ncbi:hypothetical protein FB451DRAFT_1446318, partial [Mycena latifolia]
MAHVNLGEILLTRICFLSNDWVSTPWDGGIHRGVWTGNRFDIVPSKWLEGQSGDGNPWTDVTEEVLKEFEEIWCAEY